MTSLSECYDGHYLADQTDPCVFYRCIGGKPDGPHACAPGSATALHSSKDNPCTVHMKSCKGQGT